MIWKAGKLLHPAPMLVAGLFLAGHGVFRMDGKAEGAIPRGHWDRYRTDLDSIRHSAL